MYLMIQSKKDPFDENECRKIKENSVGETAIILVHFNILFDLS